MTLGLSIRTLFILGLLSLVSCGGGGGGKSNPPSSSSAHAISTSSASSISSAALDTTPETFLFNEISNAELGVLVTSSPVTISGINAAASISVVGGEYSIDGGQFTAAAGTISNGQTLTLRVTSAEKTYTPKEAVVKVGEVTAKFTVTTFADVTPEAFTFTPVKEATLNTEYASSVVTVKGIDVAVAVSINGGVYSINGGAFTSAAGTVSADQTITVKVTSAPKTDTTNTAVLTIGGVTGSFAVSTFADKTPPVAEFKFPTPYTMSEANEVKVRGIATDDNAITEVKLVVRSFNQDTTLDETEVVAVPASETDGVKDFSSWTATIPLIADAENEIKVVATDEKNNVIALEEANKVVIRQAAIPNAFPNSMNGIEEYRVKSSILDNYDGRERLLINNSSDYTISAIDLATGERSPFFVYGDVCEQNQSYRSVIDSVTESLYFYCNNKIHQISLNNGSLINSFSTGLGTSNNYWPGVVVDRNTDRAKLVYVEDSNEYNDPLLKGSRIFTFDLINKQFSTLSSEESEPLVLGAGLSLVAIDDSYFVTTGGQLEDAKLHGIIKVNATTGQKEFFSNNLIGDGDVFSPGPYAVLTGLVFDKKNNRLLAFETGTNKIFEIDFDSRKRRIVNQISYVNTQYPEMLIEQVSFDQSNDYLFLTDMQRNAILIFDLITGEKVILSKRENEL